MEGLLRFELLVKEALSRDLQDDPDVVETAKKVMVQKLIQKELEARSAPPTDAELAAYYESHKSDYVRPERIAVVPNGIDIAGWPSPGPKGEGGSFHIVYLANLFRDKGAHIMLRALPAIIERVPDVRVSFAGKWIDREFQEECEGLIREHRLADHVEFLGVVGGDDKRRLLESADLVAFVPVKPEGLPWVVREGMASARPVR